MSKVPIVAVATVAAVLTAAGFALWPDEGETRTPLSPKAAVVQEPGEAAAVEAESLPRIEVKEQSKPVSAGPTPRELELLAEIESLKAQLASVPKKEPVPSFLDALANLGLTEASPYTDPLPRLLDDIKAFEPHMVSSFGAPQGFDRSDNAKIFAKISEEDKLALRHLQIWWFYTKSKVDGKALQMLNAARESGDPQLLREAEEYRHKVALLNWTIFQDGALIMEKYFGRKIREHHSGMTRDRPPALVLSEDQ